MALSEDQSAESEDLDLVTVARSAGTSAEMEALSVQALLEANGIDVVLVGDTRYPNFPEEVRVARKNAARAEELIREALAAGPQGAEEAESAGEQATG
jgi:PHP family Zn ribbon phosphoesterase